MSVVSVLLNFGSILLYDSIDHQNVWHRDFYATLVEDLVRLLRGHEPRGQGVDIDLREGPRYEVGIHICSFREAIRIYETAGRKTTCRLKIGGHTETLQIGAYALKTLKVMRKGRRLDIRETNLVENEI